MTLRVTIDRSECISCGACWGECPDFFEENADDHFSEVAPQYREDGHLGAGNAPLHLGNCVNQAAESCPVGIIHLES